MRWMWLLVAVACSKSADAPKAVDPPPPPAKHQDRHDPPVAASKLVLTITIAGATTTWHDDAFVKVPKLVGTATDGEARDTWSLRELVHTNVGSGARVIAVTSADGVKQIDAAAWDDATKIPILHTTKRGTLKFRWADPSGTWGETVLKDVTGLEVSH
jgi:hypothetical protein